MYNQRKRLAKERNILCRYQGEAQEAAEAALAEEASEAVIAEAASEAEASDIITTIITATIIRHSSFGEDRITAMAEVASVDFLAL